ncbi:MAG: hypothetical protein GWO20_02755, partial [Candidatus Korarchaeota archaeon]|nr:hypothetical protein [Candidatus Korarchaeota archaeon]NIW51057.1 hypothetical protein [Candidatus Korarchaeota archaeon]
LKNPDGKKHAKVLENLDNPDMFLIGFRHTYETGNEKYNDLVLSLELREGLWDLNGDGKFDMRDIGIIVKAFGTK